MKRITIRGDRGVMILPETEVEELLGKLAAYEDTGMEPEDLLAYGVAKQKGRLMVIPCDIGDEMWGIRSFNHGKRVMKGTVTDIRIIPGEGLGISVRGVCFGKYGQEVFYTQEEAAAALERMI